MATYTKNYNLLKPDGSDFYLVEVPNMNMEIIDEELKKLNDGLDDKTVENIGAFGFIRALSGGEDLNNLLTLGSYSCTSANAATIKNSPITAAAFHVHVFNASFTTSSATSARPTIQMLTATSINDKILYWRKHTTGEWTDWKALANKEDFANYVPLNGRVPMTGSLIVNNGTGEISADSNAATLVSYTGNEAEDKRVLALCNQNFKSLDEAVRWLDKTDGVQTYYKLFGEHNKPKGKYVGNGSSASRTISTGGIGSALVIHGETYSSFVTYFGAIVFKNDGTDLKAIGWDSVRFIDGVLTIKTTDRAFNQNAGVYNYQVL